MDTDAAASVKSTLILMMQDSNYNTEPSYSANTAAYPNNLIPFVDKHMNYLQAHPATDPSSYVRNLQLMSIYKKK